MPTAKQGTTGPEHGNPEMELSRCLVDGDLEAKTLARRSRGKTFGLSIVIEILLVGLLVFAPLLTTTAQPQIDKTFPPQLTFFRGAGKRLQNRQTVTTSTINRPLIPNPFAPNEVVGPAASARHNEDLEDSSIPEMPGGDGAGDVLMTGIVGTQLPIQLPRVIQPPPQEKHPVKLSEGVLEAQIISRIEPRYPPFAVELRQSGTVVLHAIINRDGRIGALEVVSGSPFFVQAALDAVRQWRYRPTLLNGEPVEVETTITVLFHLQS